MPSLEEPEVDVTFVVPVSGWVEGEVNKATVALHTFCGLAYTGLTVSVRCCPFSWERLTSLYEMETPGNLVDCTTVTFSGVGGNAADIATVNALRAAQ